MSLREPRDLAEVLYMYSVMYGVYSNKCWYINDNTFQQIAQIEGTRRKK